MRIEHLGLRAEVPKDPLGFERKQAATGVRVQRAVEQENARRM